MTNPNPSVLSRRSLLKTLGIGAGALAVGAAGRPLVARAQTGPTSALVGALTRFTVGDIAVTMIQDGAGIPFPPDFIIAGAEPSEVEAIAEASNQPAGRVFGGFNLALLEIGDQRILLDSGNGAAAQAEGTGKLLPTLELLGIAPEDINGVIFSHFHPDHINGAISGESLVFPNATYYFPEGEAGFLRNATNLPAEFQGIVDAANALLDAAESSGQLELFGAEAEVIPGVMSMPAPGHTPGHVALMLSSGNAQLLGIYDAAISPVYSLARPDLPFSFDADPATAAETRLALLGRAADEQIQIYGYHFPFPGVGYVAREGEGFRFIASV